MLWFRLYRPAARRYDQTTILKSSSQISAEHSADGESTPPAPSLIPQLTLRSCVSFAAECSGRSSPLRLFGQEPAYLLI
jgi:hypothetical protein